MKPGLQPGALRRSRLSVDRDRTISFMGEEGRVYSTPSLVRDVEHACRDLVLEHADVGEDSVGVEISIKHLAPTLPDMRVEIVATVTAVDGRKVAFSISATDEIEQICTGSHARFIVDVARTKERLKAKAARRAGG
ncbi:MAG: LysR family transcriptional regulator [Proteobacteria bacterium]|nr:LysR family transcriptional regulator [Pseudomonadota bacterium]